MSGSESCFHNQIQSPYCDFPTIPNIHSMFKSHKNRLLLNLRCNFMLSCLCSCCFLCLHWHCGSSSGLLLFASIPIVYWKRKLRGCDLWLTSEHNLGNRRSLTSSLVLGKYTLPTVSTVGTFFKDIDLRKQCVIETR